MEPVTTYDSKSLHLPEGVHYECVQCGKSCSLFEEIRVEPEMVEQIRARPAEALRGALAPENPVVPNPDRAGEFQMRFEGKGCCMQRPEDRLCALHREFGYEAKPNVCRSFPYRFIETPEGAFAGVSFACTAVLGSQGPAVNEQRTELEAQREWTVHRTHLDADALALATQLPLSWDQYKRLESDLDSMFHLRHLHVGERLLCQAIYLKLLVPFLRQVRASENALLAGPEVHDRPFDLFRVKMYGVQENAWARVRELATRGRPSSSLRRLILGLILTLRHGRKPGRGRMATYLHALGGFYRHLFNAGSITLPFLNAPIPVRALEGVAFDPTLPAHDELLERYFRHVIFRKDLLGEESILRAHQMLMVHWALLRCYSTALACEAGRAAVTIDELSEAVRHLERYHGFHSDFARQLAHYPALQVLTDRLFNRAAFALSMV